MSFGFSAGDIIAVSQLARNLWKGFVDSPDQYKAIRSEVAGLCIVLDELSECFSTCHLSDKQKIDLPVLVQSCQDVLNDLDKVLKRHGLLDVQPDGFKTKSKRVWERVKWDQKEVAELRARLTSQVTLLDAFNGSLASQVNQEIKSGISQMDSRIATLQLSNSKQERETMINWISPLDFRSQHHDFIQRQEHGTGIRFLEAAPFKYWLRRSHQELFCPGIPGAGKTIMAATIVDHLEKMFAKTSEKFPGLYGGIVYLYCNYRRQLEQTALNLFGSIARQLAEQQAAPSDQLTKKSHPNLDEILDLVRAEVARFPRVFIVLDALDECINSYNTQELLIKNLKSLTTNFGVNLLVTSRFLPDITSLFEQCPQQEIRADTEDVKMYLHGQLGRLPRFVMRNPSLQDNIVEAVAKAVDGMFLLAQLHLDSLADKTTPKSMKLALHGLPKGADALKAAYNSAVERIDSQKPGLRDLADQVLSWITFARRPLRTLELCHALATEIGENYLDEDNLTDILEMIGVCAGLVTVDENSQIIRFIHYTTQEYFESIRDIRFPAAANNVALVCVTYLMFDDLEDGLPLSQYLDTQSDLNQRCVFAQYSATHWGHHVREGSPNVLTEVTFNLLQLHERLQTCIALSGYFVSTHTKSDTNIGLYLAASFGLVEVTRKLIENGANIDCKLDGQTALYIATTNGFVDEVQLLLESGADLELNGGSRGTALCSAAYHGHNDILKLLIPRSFTWWRHGTALQEATNGGHVETVEYLLSQGADINSPFGSGNNLACAITKGQVSIVRNFLDRGAEMNIVQAVTIAANEGHADIVQLLLDKDGGRCDPGTFITPGVEAAATWGHKDVIQLLLQDRPENYTFISNGALSAAARFGSIEVLGFLLSMFPRFARLDVLSTILYQAIKPHNEETIDWVLSHATSRSSNKSLEYVEPLKCTADMFVKATKIGSIAIIKRLLSLPADIDGLSSYSFGSQSAYCFYRATPLQAACQSGILEIAELFIKNKADINKPRPVTSNRGSSEDKSPLMIAAAYGNSAIVHLLLKHGAFDETGKIWLGIFDEKIEKKASELVKERTCWQSWENLQFFTRMPREMLMYKNNRLRPDRPKNMRFLDISKEDEDEDV